MSLQVDRCARELRIDRGLPLQVLVHGHEDLVRVGVRVRVRARAGVGVRVRARVRARARAIPAAYQLSSW